MRYFSRGWFEGEFSDADADQVHVDYQRRIDEVLHRLSPSMLELADLNLHDALIEDVDWNPRTNQLRMSFIAGDLQVGYLGVTLAYGGALLGDQRVETLEALTKDPRIEVLGDEVDVDDDGMFQHRLIFWPIHELTIDFEDLVITKEDRPDRQVKRHRRRFEPMGILARAFRSASTGRVYR